MAPIGSFTAATAQWQNFYLLVGTAAATLVGLMFVAITFGANLVTKETSNTVRSFIDPTFTHFVQVLLTACLIAIPVMGAWLLGSVLLLMSALRSLALVKVFRDMLAAHRRHNDLELSDWATGIVIPLLCYLVVAAAGLAFLTDRALAFHALAIATVSILLTGIFSAWELILWIALARTRAE
jgi:hypothetical protein